MQNNTFLDFDPINTFFFPESHSRMHNEHTKPFPKVASKKTHVRLSPPFYQTLSARCVRTVRVHTYNAPKHQKFISFIHLWAGMQFGILVIHSQREREGGEKRETEKALVRQNRHSHSVIQSGHPITSFSCPECVYVCVSACVYACVWTPPSTPSTPMSVSLAPRSASPPREGGSRLFEVSLQLRGLTLQVSPWLFTQSWCNSAGKPRLCHEYKAGLWL